jgi:DNA-directed RNA polymerase specialized sigma24 family protein
MPKMTKKQKKIWDQEIHDQKMKEVAKIAEYLSNSFAFPGYDKDDIKQEALVIGLSIIHKHDDAKGNIEDFLYISIRNRLQNLKQKHYHNPNSTSKYNETKKKLNNPVAQEDDSYDHPFYELEIAEMVEMVETRLHPHMKRDYAKIRDGLFVGVERKKKIMYEVQRIYDMIIDGAYYD